MNTIALFAMADHRAPLVQVRRTLPIAPPRYRHLDDLDAQRRAAEEQEIRERQAVAGGQLFVKALGIHCINAFSSPPRRPGLWRRLRRAFGIA